MILLLLLNLTFANLHKCNYAENIVNLELSDWNITPKTIYAKEGDKICLKIKNIDGATKRITIEDQTTWATVPPGETTEEVILLPKKGTFKISCGAGCAGEEAKIVVESKEAYENEQREMDKKRSLRKRRNHNY